MWIDRSTCLLRYLYLNCKKLLYGNFKKCKLAAKVNGEKSEKGIYAKLKGKPVISDELQFGLRSH